MRGFTDTPRKKLGYDVAQVCVNGHFVNQRYIQRPQHNRDFCQSCGAKTITKCAECATDIPGAYGEHYGEKASPLSFCGSCGKPYIWVAAKIEAAQAMADELDELTGAEREALKKSINEIAADTPMTEVAVTRFKKLIPKMTKESADAMRRLVVDVAGKTAAELLKGNVG